MANVPRLETFQSTSSNSLSLVFAQFDFGTDLKETIDSVEAAVAQAELPEGVEPQVSSFDFASQPVIVATVGPVEGADPNEAAAITRNEVVPALLGIDGVSTAELTGGATPILDIVLDPARMAEHGISLQQVQGILFANQITLPSGSIDEGDLRLPVSTEHRFTSIEAAREPDRRRQRPGWHRGCGGRDASAMSGAMPGQSPAATGAEASPPSAKTASPPPRVSRRAVCSCPT